MKKVCTKCEKEKLLDAFYDHPMSPSGKHSECKDCLKQRIKLNHKTKEGLIAKMYSSQLKASRDRGHSPPSYTLGELKVWILEQQIFHILYDVWVRSGYDKMMIPSCDRIDSLKPYSLDNLQVVTFEENFRNACKDMSNGIFNNTTHVVQKDLYGNIIAVHNSLMSAERKTGTHHEHISELLSGRPTRRKTANGFIWEKL